MFDFLKKVFGTKSEKDIRDLQSKVDEINAIFTSLSSLSHDELRARSATLKADILSVVKAQHEKIAGIRGRIESEPDIDVNLKEELYKEIDEVEKEIIEETGKALTARLSEAYAI